MATINDLPDEIIENIFTCIVAYNKATMEYSEINWRFYYIINNIIKREMPLLNMATKYYNISKEIHAKLANDFKGIMSIYDPRMKGVCVNVLLYDAGHAQVSYDKNSYTSKMTYYMSDLVVHSNNLSRLTYRIKYNKYNINYRYKTLKYTLSALNDKYILDKNKKLTPELQKFASENELLINSIYAYLKDRIGIIRLMIKLNNIFVVRLDIQI
jgi:hypothetical protein